MGSQVVALTKNRRSVPSSEPARRPDYFLGDGVTLRTLGGGTVEARTVGRHLDGISVLTSSPSRLAAGMELRLVSHEADRPVRLVRLSPWGALRRLELVWQDELTLQSPTHLHGSDRPTMLR